MFIRMIAFTVLLFFGVTLFAVSHHAEGTGSLNNSNEGLRPSLIERTLLPKPTGPYQVGRTSFHLVDRSRKDPQGTQPEHLRELMVVVWYPSKAVASPKPATWLPPGWASLEANGFLGMLLGRSSNPAARDFQGVINSVDVHAHESAPVAKSTKRFPVIVFSPGNRMFPNEYSALLEDLASQGYVVIGTVPTGWVSVTFSDGHITPRSDAADFSLWVGDLKYVLDQATAWSSNRDSIFFGRLDLDHVGVFGHSGGANAAAMATHKDKRIKSCLTLDAGVLRPEDATGFPMLAFNAENADYRRRNPDDYQAIMQERETFLRRSKPGIAVLLRGADHNSFTDLSVIKAFERSGNGEVFIATIRAFVREFFAEFLLGKPSQLIRKGSPKYRLAEVKVMNSAFSKS